MGDTMLTKKQNIKDNREWLEAFDKCTTIYSKEDIDKLTDETTSFIRDISKKYKNICNGWVAGKDSIVLQDIINKSKIESTPIFWCGINEYPEMRKWINENKPKNLIEEVIDKYSLEYLEKHPQYLFCKGKTRQNWMSTKWKRQNEDITKYNFDLFIAGRRIKDGNQCGNKENNYIVSKSNYDVFSPLANWNAEQLLAYIKYNNIELPPFYKWDRGFLIGSIAMGEWTERAIMDKTENEVWQELYDIDKSIVINASSRLTSAREFLESRRMR